MPEERMTTATGGSATSVVGRPEYPVREYIGAMAHELAQMARFDGDEALASLLDAAADQADRSTSLSVEPAAIHQAR